MSENNIRVSLNAKDNASPVMDGVKARTIALGVAAANLAEKGLTWLINKTRSFVNAALESEAANVRLDASLRAIGAYTPELARKMQDLAGTIQDEIGGSDEYFKDIISQLLTMGIAADKVDQATRAVTALEAVGKSGARAIQAVARAVEGDYAAFDQLIPAVKQATTDTEKLEAINRTLSAGYQQQQAKLQTVGGAWAALMGRLGDAQEGFTNAIFKGLGLADTFGDMQKAVGAFLSSARWTDFLEKLESGARFARELATALTSTGGFKAVGASLYAVILAGLQDGADYLKFQIGEAWEQTKNNSWVAKGARFLGAKSAGDTTENALAAMDSIGSGRTFQSSNRLASALEDLRETVKEQNEKTEKNTDAVENNTEKSSNAPALQITVNTEAIERELADVNRRINQADQNQQQQAAAGAQNEAMQQQQGIINNAQRRIADADKILADKKDPAQALAEHNQRLADDKAAEKENAGVMQRYDNLQKRIKAAGNMKLRLSDKDQALIDAVEGEQQRQADAQKMREAAEMDKHDAEKALANMEQLAQQAREDQLEELKGIRKNLINALAVGS